LANPIQSEEGREHDSERATAPGAGPNQAIVLTGPNYIKKTNQYLAGQWESYAM
jgi:hypothetical protein